MRISAWAFEEKIIFLHLFTTILNNIQLQKDLFKLKHIISLFQSTLWVACNLCKTLRRSEAVIRSMEVILNNSFFYFKPKYKLLISAIHNLGIFIFACLTYFATPCNFSFPLMSIFSTGFLEWIAGRLESELGLEDGELVSAVIDQNQRILCCLLHLFIL